MLDAQEKARIMGKYLELEATIVNGESIGERARKSVDESAGLSGTEDPVAPVLRTALVINWPEIAMKTRYAAFRVRYPEIDSLAKLREVMRATPPLDFCVGYLGINANPLKPDQNPKYVMLRALTDEFLDYQAKHGIDSEIEALRAWAEAVDMTDLGNDPIGKIKGVGPGTVENIRLNLGYVTVKPDRHVIGVARKVLGISVSPLEYAKVAESLGINPRRFDMTLFAYGQLKGISS